MTDFYWSDMDHDAEMAMYEIESAFWNGRSNG
jgi:hypothetical protein